MARRAVDDIVPGRHERVAIPGARDLAVFVGLVATDTVG